MRTLQIRNSRVRNAHLTNSYTSRYYTGAIAFSLILLILLLKKRVFSSSQKNVISYRVEYITELTINEIKKSML